ncbi:MAG: hypothetical protein K8J08_04920, partial [Thermoanaerobaculia bacterium]|nr:hypothetical protein [Thermoanaerobaculia bacterium]
EENSYTTQADATQPELVCLSPEAGVEYGTKCDCPVCCSSEVLSAQRVQFAANRELPDFFMPSSLSGWLALSGRAAAFIQSSGFTNFRFVLRFRWTPERRLIREYVSIE